MWVTYFENIESDLAFYLTYSEFINKSEVDGEMTYVIDKVNFSKDLDSFPFKIYRSSNYGLVCYCSKDAENVKSLGNKLSSSLGVAKASIPIKFYLKNKNEDSSYLNLGLPLVNSSLALASRSLSTQLMEFGVYVHKFYIDNQQNLIIDIESSSFADLISDIEFVRFFSINFFISDFCSFGSVEKRDSDSLSFTIDILKKLKATEKRKISKIANITLSNDEIKLENIKSNSSISRQIMSVISQISP